MDMEMDMGMMRTPTDTANCECCGDVLIKGECESHPSWMRNHQRTLLAVRADFDFSKGTPSFGNDGRHYGSASRGSIWQSK